MPTYSNTGTEIVTVTQPRVLIILPGETVETNFYLKSLPTGVTFDSHEPTISPWVLLDTVSSVPSSDIDVFAYTSIVIYNASDDIITVSANDDDDNAIVLIAGSKEVWTNANGAFGSLKILTNEGSGDVYVYGTR
jgi:hypothetical protein